MLIIFKAIKEMIKRMQPHHHHINLLLVITILLIIVVIVLARPALLGYKISKQFEEIGMSAADFLKELDSVKSERLITETNLKSCESLNEDMLSDLSEERNAGFMCIQDKNKMETEYENRIKELEFDLDRIKPDFESQKKELQSELEREKIKVQEFQDRYNSLSENSANNICCKAKVDDKEIDSYIVSNNRIVCTTGEEDRIDC